MQLSPEFLPVSHRVHAAKRLEYKSITADVKQGSRRDAVLFSVSANSQHGLRRSNGDKRRAVEMLLSDPEWEQWSNRQIAKVCGVGSRFVDGLRIEVSAHRAQIERKASRNGKTYTVNTSKIGKRKPSPETKSTVDDLLNTTYQDTANRIATALENAEDDIRLWCIQKAIVEPEKVEFLNDGRKAKREWCEELLTSEYIQPGDELEAVHYSVSILDWKKAINRRIFRH